MELFPDDVVYHLTGFVRSHDLARLSQTNRQFHRCATRRLYHSILFVHNKDLAFQVWSRRCTWLVVEEGVEPEAWLDRWRPSWWQRASRTHPSMLLLRLMVENPLLAWHIRRLDTFGQPPPDIVATIQTVVRIHREAWGGQIQLEPSLMERYVPPVEFPMDPTARIDVALMRPLQILDFVRGSHLTAEVARTVEASDTMVLHSSYKNGLDMLAAVDRHRLNTDYPLETFVVEHLHGYVPYDLYRSKADAEEWEAVRTLEHHDHALSLGTVAHMNRLKHLQVSFGCVVEECGCHQGFLRQLSPTYLTSIVIEFMPLSRMEGIHDEITAVLRQCRRLRHAYLDMLAAVPEQTYGTSHNPPDAWKGLVEALPQNLTSLVVVDMLERWVWPTNNARTAPACECGVLLEPHALEVLEDWEQLLRDQPRDPDLVLKLLPKGNVLSLPKLTRAEDDGSVVHHVAAAVHRAETHPNLRTLVANGVWFERRWSLTCQPALVPVNHPMTFDYGCHVLRVFSET